MNRPSYLIVGFILGITLFAFCAYRPDGGKGNNVQNVAPPTLPDDMDVAGERVPLELTEVKERIDREILMNTFAHAKTLEYIKFSNRFFPIIEPILAEYGVPDDFKYLSVIESGLRTVTSPAGAKGYWQFMKATAAMYNLEVNDEVDERNDIEKSTRAACRYLLASKSRWGSWTAAAASYNMGDGGYSNSSKAQLSTNYYDLWLNSETHRYVPRLVALKYIMKTPEAYGLFLTKDDLYPQLEADSDVVDVDHPVSSWATFAQQYGVPYSTFRFYNPWIVGNALTNKAGKTYKVKIPKNQKRKD